MGGGNSGISTAQCRGDAKPSSCELLLLLCSVPTTPSLGVAGSTVVRA
jgi:hypothetical protein